MIACAGGWCTAREHCAHYHAADRINPVERLCPKGDDQPEEMRVRIFRPVGTWERKSLPSMLLPANPLEIA